MSRTLRTYYPLDALIAQTGHMTGLHKSHFRSGDLLIAWTRNSVYRIRSLGGTLVEVTGGWFDKKGLSPMRTSIAGCSWGGNAIIPGLAAANGLCLEFGNRLITTPVVRIVCVPREQQN